MLRGSNGAGAGTGAGAGHAAAAPLPLLRQRFGLYVEGRAGGRAGSWLVAAASDARLVRSWTVVPLLLLGWQLACWLGWA